MSEKHLTEAPWKLLCSDHKLKDIGLLKALNAYGKLDAAKSPAETLEALAEITTLAGKLKKTYQANEKVTDYLDEVIKETAKTKLSLAAAKPADDKDDADDADLKARLTSALKKIKGAAAGEGIAFAACVAKPCYGLMFAKSFTELIGMAHKKILTDLTGKTKFIIGRCQFENEAYTFVIDSVPAGLAKNLKRSLKEFTGLTCKVRVRDPEGKVVTDGDVETDDGEGADDAAEAAAPTPATPAATVPPVAAAVQGANAEAMAKFTARFKALQPEVVKAIATKTPQGDEIKQRATDAGALANKNDFAPAHQALDAVDALLAKMASAKPAAPGPPTPPAADSSATVKEIKLSVYLSGRSNLRAARENAARALKQLQQAILDKSKDEPFYKDVEAGSQKLFDFLTPIDDAVIEKLDEAGKCLDPDLQGTLNKKVCELIQKQLTALRSHPLAPFIERNPFGKFPVKQPLEVTLAALESQLS